MTISNTKAKSVYETNGERREWEIGFDFDSNVSKLNIILEDREGYQTVVEDNYLIEDGVVIYPSLESELDPIEEGYKIILFRSTPNTQEIDLRDNVTEKGLDKLTLQVQELSEQVDRAVKVPLVEEGVNEYQDLVLKVREERDSALEQIKEATSVVSDYTQESSLNAVISKEEADRAVEASNVSVMASSDAEAFATKAENLANEAHNAVSAYVNGLGDMRNAVLDLGVFEDNQRRASSSIIDFDFEPLDVFVRFSDSEKKMWIKGSNSFAGIEKVGDKKYKIFYSISSEDFSSQSAIKGPFHVQYVIKYSAFSDKPVVYRGRVDTVEALPEEAKDGDLWYVGPVEQENKEEYIWFDGRFELLGVTSKEDYDTLHNDLDELGDQVAEIESKIPEGTSDTNPLVNKQQMNETDNQLQTQINALAEAIQGGGSVPENVYTEDNLLGGKDIEIVKKSGGIDENTVACWHFDDSPYDEVSGLGIRYDTTGSYMAGKFGKAIGNLYGGRLDSAEGLLADKIFVKEEWTVDCWLATNVPNASNLEFHYNIGDTSGYYGIKAEYYPVTGVINLLHKYQTIATTTIEPHLKTEDDKPHFAFQKKGVNAEVFVNGKRRLQKDLTNYLSGMSGKQGVTVGGGSSYMKMDELRVSKVARYDGDFEPPTAPYEAGSAGSVINFTGQSGKNIGEVYYSQSSLASDNAGALPLFTGETIASANTIYPDFYAWVESHTELQTTAEEYETALTTYGECAKYVVSNGSLRLPKLTNYIKMANAAEGITQSEAGLPNITGQTNFAPNAGMRNDAQPRGAFYKATATGHILDFPKGAGNDLGFDASLSSEVYGKSDTVTPAHTTLFPWVFAYNATVPASTAQAAEFQEGLSGKADADLNNTIPSKTFRENVFNWGLPDLTSGVTKSWNTDITAETNGWVRFQGDLIDDKEAMVMSINGENVFYLAYRYDAQGTSLQMIPVSKGDVYKCYGASGGQKITFYPCKGEVL